jgi:Zn-dependent protease
MKENELLNLSISIIILFFVIGFQSIIAFALKDIFLSLIAAFVIIICSVFPKKIVALRLDSNVQHSIWFMSRYGFKPSHEFKKSIPIGVILPLFLTAFTLGAAKIMTILTFESHALKRRAAKKHGHYAFTEISEYHNALIASAGIITVLTLSFVTYWIPGLEFLSRMAAFYAFFNLIPFSKLDGSQIFFGSRTLWYSIAIITLIFAVYALILP